MTAVSAEILRQHGIQPTAQRLAVLRAVSDQPHVTAESAAAIVEIDIGAISRQAVYDALSVLVDKGLVRRIQPVGSAARYEGRVNDNHHHLICRVCFRVVDVDCAVGAAPCLQAADEHGFDIDEADVAYWGRCPECQFNEGTTLPSEATPRSSARPATSGRSTRHSQLEIHRDAS